MSLPEAIEGAPSDPQEILLGRGFNTMGRDGKIKVPSKEERIELRQ
jgi:hypothetical protein